MTATLDFDTTVEGWVRQLHRTGLADSTKAAYERQVRDFVEWLHGQDKHDPDELLTDRYVRDYAVRDYRRWLLTEKKAAPKTVDLALTAIASMCTMLGWAKPDVQMAAGKPTTAPRALNQEQIRDVLRAAERRGIRDHAIIATFLGTGLRISEFAALDVDDVWVTERRGEVRVRAGKGDKARTVPLNTQTRAALRRWLAHRPEWPNANREPALFLTRRGTRPSVRGLRHTVAQVGAKAGVEDLSPHVLRHTFGTVLTRAGVDVVTVAELMGHADVNTTRGYSRPSSETVANAVEHLHVDY